VVFEARYAFGKVFSVSLVGGRPVGMGNDIVTTGAICRDIYLQRHILEKKNIFIFLSRILDAATCIKKILMNTCKLYSRFTNSPIEI